MPRGFIPTLDQGYAIVVVQLPDGASLSRTDAVVQRASEIMQRDARACRTPSPSPGFSGATFTNASNAAAIFARFKPFEERLEGGQSADEIIGELFGRLQAIEEAFIIAIPPPPVRGIGNSGGFKMQMQERTAPTSSRVLAAAYEMMGKAQQNPEPDRRLHHLLAPARRRSTSRSTARRRSMLNVPIANIFETLQVNLGTAYVNDFNAFGRVYQVRAQADQRFRVDAGRHQAAEGALLDRRAGAARHAGRDPRASPAPIWCSATTCTRPCRCRATPRPASRRARRSTRWSSSPARCCRRAWASSGPSSPSRSAQTGNTAIFIFALSVLFVFLVLAAQYESWSLPLAIILIVPMACCRRSSA